VGIVPSERLAARPVELIIAPRWASVWHVILFLLLHHAKPAVSSETSCVRSHKADSSHYCGCAVAVLVHAGLF
jgi:hypothetical protein